MRRYYFELTDENYNDLGVFIPDCSSKLAAIGKAKKWMQENGVTRAILAVNSMRTDNLLDVIDIEIEPTSQNNHHPLPSTHMQNKDSEFPMCAMPEGNKTTYVRSYLRGLSPNNSRRAISTISAEEYTSFCKTRIGLFYLLLNDYCPCNLQCGHE